MYDVVTKSALSATVFIGAAAVADYRPVRRDGMKFKKSEQTLSLVLEPTEDILAAVANSRQPGQLIVGFAAETNDVVQHAKEKLERKGLDLIVANDITLDGAGFDTTTNIVTLIERGKADPQALPKLSKREVADRILDRIVALRNGKANAAQ
jgi:phosphopantothenoylcysteine decarboxylase/phosphopantothenate--cysteine ligase